MTLKGVIWIRVRLIHSEGVYPQVQMGERHLPRLTRRHHGLRNPIWMLGSERILGAICVLERAHVIQQVYSPMTKGVSSQEE